MHERSAGFCGAFLRWTARGLVAAATAMALTAAASTPARASVLSAESAADPAAAEAAYAEASQHFEASAYLEAAEALERAYALDPQPDYLYQRGQALRMAGNCPAAVAVFEDVRADVDSDEARSEIDRWIEHCEKVLAAASPAAEIEALPPGPPLPTAAQGDVPPPTPRIVPRRDLAAGLTLGAGAAAVVVGAALLGSSASLAGRRPGDEAEPEFDRRVEQVRRREIAGAVVLSVGAVAVTAAVIRYGILHRRSSQDGEAARRSTRVSPFGVFRF